MNENGKAVRSTFNVALAVAALVVSVANGEIVPASRASGGLAGAFDSRVRSQGGFGVGAFDSRYRTSGVSKGGDLRSDLPRGSVLLIR